MQIVGNGALLVEGVVRAGFGGVEYGPVHAATPRDPIESPSRPSPSGLSKSTPRRVCLYSTSAPRTLRPCTRPTLTQRHTRLHSRTGALTHTHQQPLCSRHCVGVVEGAGNH